MSCREIRSRLEKGTPPSELGADERAHVESCESCSTVLEQQSLVSRSLSMVAVAEPPIGTAERAHRAAMSGESRISPVTFWERLLPLATPVAAGAVVAGAIAFYLAGPPPVQPGVLASSSEVAASELLDGDAEEVELALADELFALEDE